MISNDIRCARRGFRGKPLFSCRGHSFARARYRREYGHLQPAGSSASAGAAGSVSLSGSGWAKKRLTPRAAARRREVAQRWELSPELSPAALSATEIQIKNICSVRSREKVLSWPRWRRFGGTKSGRVTLLNPLLMPEEREPAFRRNTA
jgi:hypothetical protein